MTTRKQFPNSPLAHQQLLKTPLKLFPLFFITSSKLWEYSWHPFHPFEFPGTQLRVQQTLGSIGRSEETTGKWPNETNFQSNLVLLNAIIIKSKESAGPRQ